MLTKQNGSTLYLKKVTPSERRLSAVGITVTQKKEQIAAAVDAGRDVYKQEIAKAKAAGTED